MTDALNICPCCKGEARYMSVRWEVVDSGSLHIGYAKVSECVVRCVNCGLSTKLCRSLAEAGALWNRREQVRDVQALNEAQALAIQQLTTQLTQSQEDAERYRLRVNELLAQRDWEEWGKSIRLRHELEEVIGTSDFEEAVRRVKAWQDRAESAVDLVQQLRGAWCSEHCTFNENLCNECVEKDCAGRQTQQWLTEEAGA
jgi:hypothetical protein